MHKNLKKMFKTRVLGVIWLASKKKNKNVFAHIAFYLIDSPYVGKYASVGSWIGKKR